MNVLERQTAQQKFKEIKQKKDIKCTLQPKFFPSKYIIND